jgi:FG-GAP-like repeat
MELAFGIAGLVIGVIGIWLTIRAMVQHRRSQRQLNAQLLDINQRLIVRFPNGGSKAGQVDFVAVDAADVNHDGQNELLIQHWAGNHGTALRMFGWDADHEFEEMGRLGTDTTGGFTVGDLDGDGRIEIATVADDYDREIAPGRMASNADGALVELLFRWDGHEFVEVGRRPLPLPTEDRNPVRLWHTNPLPNVPGGASI